MEMFKRRPLSLAPFHPLSFHRRKKRKGAFREDRYHATAEETNHHLISCLTYIDLNMVRAGGGGTSVRVGIRRIY